jgi:hypothetical protein
MKRIPVLLLLVFSIACTRNHFQSLIIGKWELRKSAGGISGTLSYPPGNGYVYQFNRDGNYYFNNNTLSATGRYRVWTYGMAGQYKLELNSTHIDTITITFDSGQLVFLPAASCCDIPTYFFARILP